MLKQILEINKQDKENLYTKKESAELPNEDLGEQKHMEA